MRANSVFGRVLRVVRYTGKLWPLYALGALILAMQNTMANLVLGQSMRTLLDLSAQGGGVAALLAPLALRLVVMLAIILCGFALLITCVAVAERNLRIDVFTRVVRAQASILLSRHSGEWVTMVTQHPNKAKEAIDWPFVSFLMGVLGPVSAFAVIASRAWALAIPALIAGCVLLLVNIWIAPRLKKLTQEGLMRYERITARLLDIIQGYAVIRAFPCAERAVTRFMRVADELYALFIRRGRLMAARQTVSVLFCSTIDVVILLLGAAMAGRGLVELGVVVELAPLVAALAWGISYAAEAYTELLECTVAVERVEEALALPQEQLSGRSSGPREQTCAELTSVTFAYPSRPEDDVLRGLSLTLRSGETLALVGPSGGGKSTVLRLLLRLYERKSGDIAIDGAPLADWSVDALRARFALVPQMPQLFDGTVLENIELGRPGAPREDIQAAARLANADEFVRALPNGYDTRVGERGAQLSGGQCQRIAIARAFLKDAPVLLLDEATASLDGVSEAAVQQALQTLMQGRTVLLVAHRLSTARTARRILYVADGSVQEEGSHDELMARGGLYAALWRAQNEAQTA